MTRRFRRRSRSRVRFLVIKMKHRRLRRRRGVVRCKQGSAFSCAQLVKKLLLAKREVAFPIYQILLSKNI